MEQDYGPYASLVTREKKIHPIEVFHFVCYYVFFSPMTTIGKQDV